MKYFILILAIIGLYGGIAQAQAPTGYYVRTDCDGLSTPVSNGAVCLQTTTTGGRTAGRLYIWTGAAWTLVNASSVSVDSTTLTGTGTDVQAVFEELDNTIDDHIADSAGAHAGTAISNTPAGGVAATTVQAAINELDTEAAKLDGTNFFTSDNTFEDGDGFKIGNAADGTRRFRFDASGISGGATRTYTAPDSNGTLALTSSNVATATALASNPTDCAAGAYANTIAASGNLGCEILIVSSASDPTTDDDTGDGYIVGTTWINTTTDKVFHATDVTAAAAVWVSMSEVVTHGELTELDDDDHSAIYVKYEVTAGAPAADSCDRAGQIQFDTTGKIAYGCYEPGDAPVNFGDQGDSYLQVTGNTGSATASGGNTLALTGAGGTDVVCADGTPDTCTITSNLDHGTLTGLTDNDHSAVYCLFTVSNADPGAGAVTSDCHLWINDAVTPKRIFYGEGVGNNFEDFAALGDAHNAIHVGSSGTADAAASGSEDVRYVKALDLPAFMEAFNGTTAFANHPSNDGIEYVSSEAADTTQTITAYCTINSGDQSLTFLETATLNGVTQVATTRTDWDKCYAFKLSATATGTVTIREASGNATIATIAPGETKVADLDTVFHRQDYISLTLHIDRDTGLADTDDRSDFWINTLGRVFTITQIKGWTDTGTSTINIQRDDGSAADICTSNLVASTSGVTCTLSATEKLISDGHKLKFVMVTAATTGTPTKVTVNIKGY